MLNLESKLQVLLELSDEYYISTLKNLIEKHMIKNISDLFLKKSYGKVINDNLDEMVAYLNLAKIYQLKKLKIECIQAIAFNFSKKQLETNTNFISLENGFKLDIYGKKVDYLEEKVQQSELKLKQRNDENLKQKLEIKRLQSNQI